VEGTKPHEGTNFFKCYKRSNVIRSGGALGDVHIVFSKDTREEKAMRLLDCWAEHESKKRMEASLS